ncbi:winged helix DNA-binding protein [Chromobacterium piscinae]|uniref:Winged helix DNA-binding protein n=1 Tax=Chromobacterium piscinae TaxID=686831 RepID=A0ABV0H8V3_9NEIS
MRNKRNTLKSPHLVKGYCDLPNLESSLVIAFHAYSRWITRCMVAACGESMGAIDVLVLRYINSSPQHAKRLTDVCIALNIVDSYIVSYALKKMIGLNLVCAAKNGKENFYKITKQGARACEQYNTLYEACFIAKLNASSIPGMSVQTDSRIMQYLAVQYDMASRELII